MKRQTDRVRKLTMGAMLCALSVLVLISGLFLHFNQLGVLVLASLIVSICIYLTGRATALTAYVAAALVSTIIMGFTDIAMAYAICFGAYPLVRTLTARLHGAARTAVNVAVGLALAAGAAALYRFLFIPDVVLAGWMIGVAVAGVFVYLLCYELLIDRFMYSAVQRLRLKSIRIDGSKEGE